jgi:hypothetical protein
VIHRPVASTTLTMAKMRTMAEMPCIKYPLAFSCAPIMSASWGVEGESKEAVKFITEQVLPHRDQFLASALFAGKVFGWSAWEVIFNVDQTLHALKLLDNRYTYARRDKNTGEYLGLKSESLFNSLQARQAVYIDAEHSLFATNGYEAALGGYGKSAMEGIETIYDAWLLTNDSANRWGEKMAGGMWQVNYPPGQSKVNGVEIENSEIARTEVSQAIRGGKVMTLPTQPFDLGNGKIENAWNIEFKESSSSSVDFLNRLKHLEALMAQGLLVSAQAVSEGILSGSRAETESQVDVSLLNMEIEHRCLVNFLNDRLVNRLLIIRFGEEGLAKIVAAPIVDEAKLLYKQLVSEALKVGDIGGETVDWNAMVDTLGIPMVKEIVVPTREEKMQEQKEAFEQQQAVAEAKGEEQPE